MYLKKMLNKGYKKDSPLTHRNPLEQLIHKQQFTEETDPTELRLNNDKKELMERMERTPCIQNNDNKPLITKALRYPLIL